MVSLFLLCFLRSFSPHENWKMMKIWRNTKKKRVTLNSALDGWKSIKSHFYFFFFSPSSPAPLFRTPPRRKPGELKKISIQHFPLHWVAFSVDWWAGEWGEGGIAGVFTSVACTDKVQCFGNLALWNIKTIIQLNRQSDENRQKGKFPQIFFQSEDFLVTFLHFSFPFRKRENRKIHNVWKSWKSPISLRTITVCTFATNFPPLFNR